LAVRAASIRSWVMIDGVGGLERRPVAVARQVRG
jgi:hypothetical protein